MFSLDSLNSVTKIFVIKRTWTCHLLCKRPRCYHSTIKTHVRDRIFKLSPFHASAIIRFPEFTEFNESCAPFRKNSIVLFKKCTHFIFWLRLNRRIPDISQFLWHRKILHESIPNMGFKQMTWVAWDRENPSPFLAHIVNSASIARPLTYFFPLFAMFVCTDVCVNNYE